MPEGDTLHQAAQRLAPLVGTTIQEVDGSHPAVRRDGRRLLGKRLDAVRSHGKHLVATFDNGWALRTHLGMTGSWHRYRPGDRWRVTPGKARVVLRTEEWVAVCFAAPTVQLGPLDLVLDRIAHLGPDLIHDDVDWDEVAGRALQSDARTVSDLLLDQTVMAGIGNVYRNETLFLEGISPQRPAARVDADQLKRLGARAQRLLIANAGNPRRSTTGDRRRRATAWVYGRGGEDCRRCRGRIELSGLASPERLTYWCPRCQPD